MSAWSVCGLDAAKVVRWLGRLSSPVSSSGLCSYRYSSILFTGTLASGLLMASTRPKSDFHGWHSSGFRKCVLLEETKSAPATKRPASGNINVDQEMLKRRVIFITGEVNDDS